MATYNGERFLAQQLRTISEQTRTPDELVIVDDCSCDRTTEIIRQYAARAAFPVRTATNTRNSGYSLTFEAAAARCRGDITCFCDQDDLWHTSKLEQIEQAFLNNPSAMCVKHDLRLVNDLGIELSPSIYRMLRRQGRSPSFLTKGCSIAVRTQMLEAIMSAPTHLGWAYDDWIILMAEACNKVVVLVDALADYRLHSSNVSGRVPRQGPIASCERLMQWVLFGRNQQSIFSHKEPRALLELLKVGNENCYFTDTDIRYLEINVSIATARENLLTLPRSTRFLKLIRLLGMPNAHLAGATTFLHDFFRPQVSP